jgi:hypothetical protein
LAVAGWERQNIRKHESLILFYRTLPKTSRVAYLVVQSVVSTFSFSILSAYDKRVVEQEHGHLDRLQPWREAHLEQTVHDILSIVVVQSQVLHE